MLTLQFFASWLTYLVITFVLAYFWHLKIFKSLYDRLEIYTRIDDPIIALGFLSMVIQGGLLAYLYPLMAHTGSPAFDGIKFGLLMGIFLASSAVLAEAAKQKVTSLSTWLIVESIYYIIQYVLCGLAIGLIYGY